MPRGISQTGIWGKLPGKRDFSRGYGQAASGIPGKQHKKRRGSFPAAAFVLETAYCEMASAGHPATQAPQSMHLPSSTTARPSFMEMASTGQVLTHDSQPTHLDSSTFAAMAQSSFFDRPCFTGFSRSHVKIQLMRYYTSLNGEVKPRLIPIYVKVKARDAAHPTDDNGRVIPIYIKVKGLKQCLRAVYAREASRGKLIVREMLPEDGRLHFPDRGVVRTQR